MLRSQVVAERIIGFLARAEGHDLDHLERSLRRIELERAEDWGLAMSGLYTARECLQVAEFWLEQAAMLVVNLGRLWLPWSLIECEFRLDRFSPALFFQAHFAIVCNGPVKV